MGHFSDAVLISCMSLAAVDACYAQQNPAPLALEPASTFGAAREIPLYPGVAPGSENWSYSESTRQTPEGLTAINVVRPVLLYFPAPRTIANGTAMIVCPGGGFQMLMMSYEGVDIAKSLNDAGVDAFILKYRLWFVGPNAPHRVGLDPATSGPQAGQNIFEISGADGRQAVNLLRTRAAEFGIQPNRIGMIGFSAGGGPIYSAIYGLGFWSPGFRIISGGGPNYAISGPAETRPNFAAMIYATFSSKGTPIIVPEGAPPLFIAVAADDQPITYQGSVDMFLAWRQANIPVELHVFQMGAHGFRHKGGGADHFMDRVKEWMQVNGWLTKAHG